jgi:Protein of unknown function (DUF3455)
MTRISFAAAAWLVAMPLTCGAGVPGSLAADSNEMPVIVLAAEGVQIYECRAAPAQGNTAYAWVLVAPEASLRDSRGRIVGRHGAGPSWESADGSRIVGTVKARADAPAAGAIAWLLLSAQASGPQGVFSAVTSVQRINTAGGIAPAAGCTQASAGSTARVAYTADYRFFAKATP